MAGSRHGVTAGLELKALVLARHLERVLLTPGKQWAPWRAHSRRGAHTSEGDPSVSAAGTVGAVLADGLGLDLAQVRRVLTPLPVLDVSGPCSRRRPGSTNGAHRDTTPHRRELPRLDARRVRDVEGRHRISVNFIMRTGEKVTSGAHSKVGRSPFPRNAAAGPRGLPGLPLPPQAADRAARRN